MRRRDRARMCLLLVCQLIGLGDAVAPNQAHAQPSLGFSDESGRLREIFVAVDEDDDDEDDLRDRIQEMPPTEDARRVHLLGAGQARLEASGPVRVLWAGRPLELPATVTLPSDVRLQATGAGQAQLVLTQTGQRAALRTHHLRIRFVGADGEDLDPTRESLAHTMSVPNDPGLPRERTPAAPDARAFFLRVEGLRSASRLRLGVADAAARRDELSFELSPEQSRTPWIRLVTDDIDGSAPGAGSQLLRARLRDSVTASVEGATQSMRVARPEVEWNARALRKVKLSITVLSPDGIPVVGDTPEGAQRIAAEQVRSINDVWAQCMVSAEAVVRLRAPPPAAMLAVGDRTGLPAAGGVLRFVAGGRRIEVQTQVGDSPMQTARRISEALGQHDLVANVIRVPRTSYGADDSADVVVRDADGYLVTLEADGEHPLSRDARQTLHIARVNLADGLSEFDNDHPAGTLEERALVTLLRDDDPESVDLFIVNAFSGASRHGEAFVPSDNSPAAGAMVVDRRGASLARVAWTAAHELGHLLLDDPLHPDERGPDTPTRLMDSNRADGSVLGPRRLTPAECARARRRGATPPYFLGRRLDHP